MVTVKQFTEALSEKLMNAERLGAENLLLNAGMFHRELGGYPGGPKTSHNMPSCVKVMHRAMKDGDKIVVEPRLGVGASVTILYQLPR